LYESVEILKKLGDAKAALARLQGRSTVIPNQGLLINSISLQEAKLSSAIEIFSRPMTSCIRTSVIKMHRLVAHPRKYCGIEKRFGQVIIYYLQTLSLVKNILSEYFRKLSKPMIVFALPFYKLL